MYVRKAEVLKTLQNIKNKQGVKQGVKQTTSIDLLCTVWNVPKEYLHVFNIKLFSINELIHLKRQL